MPRSGAARPERVHILIWNRSGQAPTDLALSLPPAAPGRATSSQSWEFAHGLQLCHRGPSAVRIPHVGSPGHGPCPRPLGSPWLHAWREARPAFA